MAVNSGDYTTDVYLRRQAIAQALANGQKINNGSIPGGLGSLVSSAFAGYDEGSLDKERKDNEAGAAAAALKWADPTATLPSVAPSPSIGSRIAAALGLGGDATAAPYTPVRTASLDPQTAAAPPSPPSVFGGKSQFDLSPLGSETVPNDANALPGTPGLNQKFADRLQDFQQDRGKTLSSGFRSGEQQAMLYADRANNPNPVAPQGSSMHERGLAADLNGVTNEDIAIAPQYGIQGLPGDRPHFQPSETFGNAAPDLTPYASPVAAVLAGAPPSSPGIGYANPGAGGVPMMGGNQPSMVGQPLAFNGAPSSPIAAQLANAPPVGPAPAPTAPQVANADHEVAVPGYPGTWSKAKIAAAPDGTDVPEDAQLAKAQGIPVSQGAPPATANSAAAVAPTSPAAAAPPIPAAPVDNRKKAIAAMLADPNPAVRRQGVTLAQTMQQAELTRDPTDTALKQQQLIKAQRENQKDDTTPDITNYEYAKKNGFTGSFTDFKQSSNTPATVKEYEYAKQNGFGGSFTDFKRVSDQPRVVKPGEALVDSQGNVKYKGDSNSTMRDDTADFLAERVLAGDTKALIGLGRGAQGAENLAKIQSLVGEKARALGLDASDLIQKSAEASGLGAQERTFGTQRARMATASTEAEGAIKLGRAASADVPRTNFVPYNKAVQMVDAGTSDPKLAKFVAANNTIVNTFARAINPNGTPHDSDKEHARQMLNTAMSQDAYNAVLDQLQTEIDLAHRAPERAQELLKAYRKGANPSPDAPAAAPGAVQPPVAAPSLPGGTTKSGLKWSIQ